MYSKMYKSTEWLGGVDLIGEHSSLGLEDSQTIKIVGYDADSHGEHSQRTLRTLLVRVPASLVRKGQTAPFHTWFETLKKNRYEYLARALF